ncbi:MAG: hypothetical protein IJ228_05050 [Succinivibrio sp.]|nr:hypothetical protein [Succinivibrio sp.]
MDKTQSYELKAEQLSELFDGQSLPEGSLSLDAEAQRQLNRWSLIGASLRGELGERVYPDFARQVMERINEENARIMMTDQAALNREEHPAARFRLKLRKAALYVTQVAAAAAIAMITVFGYQTWNAEGNYSLSEAADATLGPVGGVNLASFQNGIEQQNLTRYEASRAQLEQNKVKSPVSPAEGQDSAQLRQLQQREVERINQYLRNYVSTPAY